MLTKLKDTPSGIDAVQATGRVTTADYDKVFVPMLDEARREGRRLRFLYRFGPDFEGFTPGAAWEDARLGLRSMRSFDGCAVVTDFAWLRDATKLAGFMMPCPVKVFANSELQPALAWLGSLPESSAVSFRLLSNRGVVVIEVDHPLRGPDFDALALLVDPWIEAHGTLGGIVIHARAFPGWENLGSLLRHVRFVRDHQAKVGRVALAVHRDLVSLMPHVANVFLQAEVRAFGYDALDAAIDWAAGAAEKRPAAPVDGHAAIP